MTSKETPSPKGNFYYSFEFQRVKRISKRKIRRQKRLDSYVNPQEQQEYILKYGKEKFITEKMLRKGKFNISGVQKL